MCVCVSVTSVNMRPWQCSAGCCKGIGSVDVRAWQCNKCSVVTSGVVEGKERSVLQVVGAGCCRHTFVYPFLICIHRLTARYSGST